MPAGQVEPEASPAWRLAGAGGAAGFATVGGAGGAAGGATGFATVGGAGGGATGLANGGGAGGTGGGATGFANGGGAGGAAGGAPGLAIGGGAGAAGAAGRAAAPSDTTSSTMARPRRTRSPGCSTRFFTASVPTQTPPALSRSTMRSPSGVRSTRACRRETSFSPTMMSHVSERPSVASSPTTAYVCPTGTVALPSTTRSARPPARPGASGGRVAPRAVGPTGASDGTSPGPERTSNTVAPIRNCCAGRDLAIRDALGAHPHAVAGTEIADADAVRRRLELGVLARHAAVVEPQARGALAADGDRRLEADLVARLERFRGDDAQDEGAD